jgi:hypothetical protein
VALEAAGAAFEEGVDCSKRSRTLRTRKKADLWGE